MPKECPDCGHAVTTTRPFECPTCDGFFPELSFRGGNDG
jgi:rubrerythrin